jgi:triacylglycerol esterase/lipase EstA (alpha/beta hydrolase family)
MIAALTESGYPTNYLIANSFSSVSNGNIYAAQNEIAPGIESFLTEINSFLTNNFPNQKLKTKVDIVSHSMGGLSSRWYAAKVRPDRVRKWISLAGANHGTNDVCPP